MSLEPTKRIGLYGGTFDPVHFGHLLMATQALEQLDLDQVIFIPAAQNPHKPDTITAPASLRIEMLAAAIAPEPRFTLDTIETDAPPPSYTIHTVHALEKKFHDTQLYLLIGADNLLKLHTWKDIDTLREKVTLTVFERAGFPLPENKNFLTITGRFDITATEIRNRVANRAPIDYFVPRDVQLIMTREKLYHTYA